MKYKYAANLTFPDKCTIRKFIFYFLTSANKNKLNEAGSFRCWNPGRKGLCWRGPASNVESSMMKHGNI